MKNRKGNPNVHRSSGRIDLFLNMLYTNIPFGFDQLVPLRTSPALPGSLSFSSSLLLFLPTLFVVNTIVCRFLVCNDKNIYVVLT